MICRTRKEFISYFRRSILPHIRKFECGGIDIPMRVEAWNNAIDACVTDKQLPKCALNWSHPW